MTVPVLLFKGYKSGTEHQILNIRYRKTEKCDEELA